MHVGIGSKCIKCHIWTTKASFSIYYTHYGTRKHMRQLIDVSLHVTNIMVDGETINKDNNTLTRQQNRVSATKSSQQDGRQ